MNDPRYQERDMEEIKSGRVEMRKPSVQFEASRAMSKEVFRKQKLLQWLLLGTMRLEKSSLWTTVGGVCSGK